MAESIYQAILPSGRAVRFRRLRTREMLAIQQRVAVRLGKRDDPGDGIRNAMGSIEIIATCTIAITTSRPWLFLVPEAVDAAADPDPVDALEALAAVPSRSTPREAPKRVDVDAMLDALKPEDWIQLSYGELIQRDKPKSMDDVLDNAADFQRLLELIQNPDGQQVEGLLGKVQAVSSA
jgi:hypothetical protein